MVEDFSISTTGRKSTLELKSLYWLKIQPNMKEREGQLFIAVGGSAPVYWVLDGKAR